MKCVTLECVCKSHGDTRPSLNRLKRAGKDWSFLCVWVFERAAADLFQFSSVESRLKCCVSDRRWSGHWATSSVRYEELSHFSLEVHLKIKNTNISLRHLQWRISVFLKHHDIISSYAHCLVGLSNKNTWLGKRKRHSLAENNHVAHVTKLMRIHEKRNTQLKNKPESNGEQKQETRTKSQRKHRLKNKLTNETQVKRGRDKDKDRKCKPSGEHLQNKTKHYQTKNPNHDKKWERSDTRTMCLIQNIIKTL